MEQKTKCSLLGEVVSAMSIFSRMQNQHQGKDPEKMFVAFPLENLHLLLFTIPLQRTCANGRWLRSPWNLEPCLNLN